MKSTPRASRDGHEFHEAWAARKALQLLLPTNNLLGIAVEGLSPSDQARAARKAVEVADLVLYYGKFPTFEGSQNVVIMQFKYSVGASNDAFRHSDARKTIQKFAAAFRNYKSIHGEAEVHAKLEFELITNRPIHSELHEALRCIAHREAMRGEVKKQASQFKSACGFSGDELVEFAAKVPEAITSTVGRETIRYARLKAAVLHAAQNREYDRLVHLLSELSTIAALNQRGTLYVLENPDLVVAVHDVDATRRLFETRTAWPGTRHARLAIANLLSGQLNDAFRHVIHAAQWIQHYSRQDDEYRRERSGPERFDIAAIPMCFVAQNRIPTTNSRTLLALDPRLPFMWTILETN